MPWNLSGSTNILFSINHSKGKLHSGCNSSIKSSTVAVKELKLLSLKLWADAIRIQKNSSKSLKISLKNHQNH